jgi:methylmalonyl-CoA/ethylmalonyl-CoA epimerase
VSIETTANIATIHLDHIGQIALTVSNLERSTAFYKDVLGMTFLFNAGSMVFFQCGEIRLMIGLSERNAPAKNTGTILYFKVADIEHTHAWLHHQGVEFIQPPHQVARMADHDLWLALFTDPDNNTLAVMSEVAHS